MTAQTIQQKKQKMLLSKIREYLLSRDKINYSDITLINVALQREYERLTARDKEDKTQ